MLSSILLRLLENHNASYLPIFFFSSPPLLRNNGEFGAKSFFTDFRTANTIQLFVAIKNTFSDLFFFCSSSSKEEFLRNFLINAATFFFLPIIKLDIKGTLSSLRKFLATKGLWKWRKMPFFFTLKAFFVLKNLNFCLAFLLM